MGIVELILCAVALSMDAFAVAICKGLSMKKLTLKKAFIIGLWFGGFQALMPTIGYFVASLFAGYIEEFDHWIAFILLVLIGGNMILESLSKKEEELDDDLSFRTMLLLALATSIDALAIGVSFAMLKVNVAIAAPLIGVTTLLLSMLGVKVGNLFGNRYKKKAEFAGGCVLSLLGLKILLEGLGILHLPF